MLLQCTGQILGNYKYWETTNTLALQILGNYKYLETTNTEKLQIL